MTLDAIIKSDQTYYMNTFGARTPVAFVKGQGMELTDTEGKVYTDYLAGIAVTALGHSHPAVTQAVVTQATQLIHCSNLYYIEAQAQLERLLVDHVGAPSGLTRVFFGNSGAEANEGAIKLARAYFYKQGVNRYQIISANNSFHGRTLATVAATGQKKYQAPYHPLPDGFINVAYNSLEAIEQALSPQTCAVMLETIQGEGGVMPADPSYLKAVEALCAREGILLIVDEVQTGMGRTGKLLSVEHSGVRPHIVTLAKALANGVPIGAILATEQVAAGFAPGDHGSTFGGNPLACAAGAAVVTQMIQPGFLEGVQEMGAAFKAQLEGLAQGHRCVRAVRGLGLMLGLELEEPVSGKQVVQQLFERKLLINCAAHNTLRFVPPLIIERAHIDRLIDALDQVLPQ